MPRLATALAAQADETAPQRRISGRLREAVRLICTGEVSTLKAAAERSGMNYTYLSGALRKPETRVFMEREARQTLAAGQMRASARLVGLLDAASEHVSLDASKYVLALGGIKPAETAVSVNVELKAGFVIDISDRNATPVIDVTTT